MDAHKSDGLVECRWVWCADFVDLYVKDGQFWDMCFVCARTGYIVNSHACLVLSMRSGETWV